MLIQFAYIYCYAVIIRHSKGTIISSQIRDFEQNEELLTHGMTENMSYFDYFFKLSKNENEESTDKEEEDETTSDF